MKKEKAIIFTIANNALLFGKISSHPIETNTNSILIYPKLLNCGVTTIGILNK